MRSLAPDGLLPNRTVSVVLGFVVNVLRSLPFIILAVAVIPLTRAIVGTSLGWEAAGSTPSAILNLTSAQSLMLALKSSSVN